MQCPECGAQVFEGQEYCDACGTYVGTGTAGYTQPVAPQPPAQPSNPTLRIVTGIAIAVSAVAIVVLAYLLLRPKELPRSTVSSAATVQEDVDSTTTPDSTSETSSTNPTPGQEDTSSVTVTSDPTPTAPEPFVITSVDCSSYLVSQEWAENYYGPESVLDGDFSTVWCEGASSDGIGEWISVGARTAQTVNGIRLVDGHPTNREIYYRNNRCQDITIQLSDGFQTQVRLQDDFSSWQTIDFGGPHQTSFIRITIDSVYYGMDSDTSIAEIVVY